MQLSAGAQGSVAARVKQQWEVVGKIGGALHSTLTVLLSNLEKPPLYEDLTDKDSFQAFSARIRLNCIRSQSEAVRKQYLVLTDHIAHLCAFLDSHSGNQSRDPSSFTARDRDATPLSSLSPPPLSSPSPLFPSSFSDVSSLDGDELLCDEAPLLDVDVREISSPGALLDPVMGSFEALNISDSDPATDSSSDTEPSLSVPRSSSLPEARVSPLSGLRRGLSEAALPGPGSAQVVPRRRFDANATDDLRRSLLQHLMLNRLEIEQEARLQERHPDATWHIPEPLPSHRPQEESSSTQENHFTESQVPRSLVPSPDSAQTIDSWSQVPSLESQVPSLESSLNRHRDTPPEAPPVNSAKERQASTSYSSQEETQSWTPYSSWERRAEERLTEDGHAERISTEGRYTDGGLPEESLTEEHQAWTPYSPEHHWREVEEKMRELERAQREGGGGGALALAGPGPESAAPEHLETETTAAGAPGTRPRQGAVFKPASFTPALFRPSSGLRPTELHPGRYAEPGTKSVGGLHTGQEELRGPDARGQKGLLLGPSFGASKLLDPGGNLWARGAPPAKDALPGSEADLVKADMAVFSGGFWEVENPVGTLPRGSIPAQLPDIDIVSVQRRDSDSVTVQQCNSGRRLEIHEPRTSSGGSSSSTSSSIDMSSITSSSIDTHDYSSSSMYTSTTSIDSTVDVSGLTTSSSGSIRISMDSNSRASRSSNDYTGTRASGSSTIHSSVSFGTSSTNGPYAPEQEQGHGLGQGQDQEPQLQIVTGSSSFPAEPPRPHQFLQDPGQCAAVLSSLLPSFLSSFFSECDEENRERHWCCSE